MQIILISDRLARARSVHMSLRHLVGTGLLALVMLFGATAALYWLTLRYAADVKLPALQQLVAAAQHAEAERERVFLQQNLNSMAMKLGEMQAHLTRLDALGERLSALAGIKPQDFRFAEAPGMGGAAPTLLPPQNLSLGEFSEKLLVLARQVESRNDMLGVLEAQLFEQAVKKKMIPTMMPVRAPYNASSFGRRIDPFNGQWAMHEGIDFIADYGSPIVAAAGGVVHFRRLPSPVRLHDRHRSRQRPGDALCAHLEDRGARGRSGAARQEDRRSRHHRPLHRPAPAFRSALPGRGAESRKVPRHAPSRHRGSRLARFK